MIVNFIISFIIGQTVVAQPSFFYPEVVNRSVAINQSLGVKVDAKSAVVYDVKKNNILSEKNPDQILSIASLTKLMTALVVIEKQPDMNSLVEIKTEDDAEESKINIHQGDKVILKDLLKASLTRSANNATKAMARNVFGDLKTAVAKMNEKASQLGLTNTRFSDVTGLDPANHSTAKDLIKIFLAVQANKELRNILIKSKDNINIIGPDGRARTQYLTSTNKLLKSFLNFEGAKTGFLEEAGYCFIGEINDRSKDNDIIAVLLGSPTDETRFQDAKSLFWWALKTAQNNK
ncbi:MAG: serine hydrolase [Patescibacteria group bacterium]